MFLRMGFVFRNTYVHTYEVQIAIYNRNVSGTKLISLLTSAAYGWKSFTSKNVLKPFQNKKGQKNLRYLTKK